MVYDNIELMPETFPINTMELRDATSRAMHTKKKNISTTYVDSCRICMVPNSNMSDIFEADSKHVIKEILFCTGITIKKENGIPTKICKQCLNDLTVAYKFKTSCILADQTFHKLVKIKEEVPEVVVEIKSLDFDEPIDYDDDFGEKVKEEVAWEHVVVHNKNSKAKTTQETPQSIQPKVAPKRVGRPKSSSSAPRRLKKFKFKKLHCEPCDIKFENKQQCDDHKKTVHKDNDPWVCEICGKQFIHRASHYTHIQSHLPPKFACDQCDYKTWHKYDLVKHIRIHTGIKQYQCEYCTASYYTSGNLTGHIRRNHLKLKPFECGLCRRKFFEKTKLNRHLDTHNEVKRFECQVCHACFTRRCYWKKHLLRQHDIATPPVRPGPQKINAVVGEDLVDKVNLVISPRDPVKCLDKTTVDGYMLKEV